MKPRPGGGCGSEVDLGSLRRTVQFRYDRYVVVPLLIRNLVRSLVSSSSPDHHLLFMVDNLEA